MSDWTLLIDFGTSFTKAAIADDDGRTELIELDGLPAMPSGVWAEPSGKLIAGTAAYRQGQLAPDRWDRAPGRWLGLNEPLVLGQRSVDPVKAVAEVLRRVAAEALRRRPGKPRQVRITCSPRWNVARRQALTAAAHQAGLATFGSVQLVEQPVATALELSRQGRFRIGTKVAVLGLGGGSAETAVLESTADGVWIRALGGIEGVGGENFDDLLFRKVVAHKLKAIDPQVSSRVWDPPDVDWLRAREDLFREVRRAKEELSEAQNTELNTGALINIPLSLSRIELESVLRSEILRATRELGTTLELAGLRPRQLDGVLLTGGSIWIPLVARAVFDVIGVQPELLNEPGLYAGAAAWTPQSRATPSPTPMTVAGGQTREEAAADAAAAAAAVAATGSINLSALIPPRPSVVSGPETGPGAARAVKRVGLSAWRRRWPVILGVLLVLLVIGLVLNGPASGDDDPGPENASPTATSTIGSEAAPTSVEGGPVENPDLAPVTSVDVNVRNISVDLTWPAVPGATAYSVYRDAGTPEQTVRTIPRTTFTDRPGDAEEHEYVVVAVDEAEREGVPATPVTATATAPYGEVQAIASTWTAIVPVQPGKKGTSGQTCKGSSNGVDHSTGWIRCTFSNGVRMVISSYDSAADRDQRGAELAARKGARSGKWSAALRGGNRHAGRLLTADSKVVGGPWRWWTYTSTPEYAMYLDWPKHTPKQLTVWWNQRAPFRL